MHIPLVISILALLAFALLPVLDYPVNSKITAPGPRTYWNRVACWVKE